MTHTSLYRSTLLILTTGLLYSCSPAPDPGADMADMERLEEMGEQLDMRPDLAPDMPGDLGEAPDQRDAFPDFALDMTLDEGVDMPDVTPDMPREDMPGEDMQGDADMDVPSGPLPGFGTLSGDCQQIDDELSDLESTSFRNALDFGMDAYDMGDLMLLTPGGQAIIAAGNAGGSSLISEVFAFEVLARCESAILLETETTIDYANPMGKITDLLVEIDGERVGVSVVRALAFPFDDPYPEDEARRILTKKLEDIQLSTQNVLPNHVWVKQILSVVAYSSQHADQIEAVYQTLDADIKSDTIVYITVTDGEDRPLYFND